MSQPLWLPFHISYQVLDWGHVIVALENATQQVLSPVTTLNGDEARIDSNLGQAEFLCVACGERFDRQVWHCPGCAHHWLLSEEQCRNCYNYGPNGPLAEAAEHVFSPPSNEAQARATLATIHPSQGRPGVGGAGVWVVEGICGERVWDVGKAFLPPPRLGLGDMCAIRRDAD